MSAPFFIYNGTANATGGEDNFLNLGTVGIYEVVLGLQNMAGGDTVIVRRYAFESSSPGGMLVVEKLTFTDAQDPNGVILGPFAVVAESPLLKISLEQTAGVNRAYPWSVYSY